MGYFILTKALFTLRISRACASWEPASADSAHALIELWRVMVVCGVCVCGRARACVRVCVRVSVS